MKRAVLAVTLLFLVACSGAMTREDNLALALGAYNVANAATMAYYAQPSPDPQVVAALAAADAVAWAALEAAMASKDPAAATEANGAVSTFSKIVASTTEGK